MKVLEVSTLHAGINQLLSNLWKQREQLKQIEGSIQAIVDLQDSFKGEGGQAIRGFFQSYHLSFLQDLFSFYNRYIETLEQIQNNLMALEPAADGFIRESYLEHEVSNGLETIKERTISLTDETNQVIASVADIVALPKLDDSDVLNGIKIADQQRDETIGKLHTFDQQQVSTLLPLENTVQAMVQYVQHVSTLFQARNGSIPSIESIYYSQNLLQPTLSLFAYSNTTMNKLSAWNHFYLNYLKNNPNPEVEQLISAREAEALIRQATEQVQVIDEYNGINEVSAIDGKYYTLPDGRILREYYSPTGVYKYEYVDSIPEERIGGVKTSGSEAVSVILDFIPFISNGKAAVEALVGEDIITGRELSNVERGILVAAIFGGPIVKGIKIFGKSAMKQLSKVQNVLNPDKVKSFANGLYEDYIKQSINKGFSAAKSLVKKIADTPMPFSPKLATANGLPPVTKTIGESITEAKESVMQMAGKVKESVAGQGAGNKISKASDDIIRDGSHIVKDGTLKPNVKYQTGEYEYLYETDNMGRLKEFNADELKLTERDGRLPHKSNTPGKETGDHAGHIAADRFGGSPELDNLVSQSSSVNLSKYKKLENKWARVIEEGKHVSVNVKINYQGNNVRPSGFDVEYEINGRMSFASIEN